MLGRELFRWRVKLTALDTGAERVVQFASYWSPEHTGTSEAVGLSAAAMESVNSRKRFACLGTPERIAAAV